MQFLPYDPGRLPTKNPPSKGDKLHIKVTGLPPFKDLHFSIRNPRHPNYSDFKRLRDEAIKVMDGRAWYFGPVQMEFTLYSPTTPQKTLIDYGGGIMDTLDGSSGPQFTYLPIVFEDDCQVFSSRSVYQKSEDTWYTLEITFL
jgi:hypothetical protein